ncbi:hypothetical protein MSAN_00662000 [Mycena sanguinolenta]|uniref:Uncharacterized protein n=1 Tax=Mycena sanguinolenta TaxID=230812 RepID=A0A8H6Z3S6_9AGAR|nr:hypothetical protein MSAN_00662000 [Mycena sanguinolenta]
MSNQLHEQRSPLVEDIFSGKEMFIPVFHVDHYHSAARALASLNFLRIVRERIEKQLPMDKLFLQDVLSQKTLTEEVLPICAEWPSILGLGAEDILEVMPISQPSSRPGSRSYDELSRRQLRAVVSMLQSISMHAAVVITCRHSQEIITCFKLAIDSNIPTGPGFRNVFIIFETRPTTDHPNYAGPEVRTSPDATAHRLHIILDLDDECDVFVNGLSLYWYSHSVVAQRRKGNNVEEWKVESNLVQHLLHATTNPPSSQEWTTRYYRGRSMAHSDL